MLEARGQEERETIGEKKEKLGAVLIEVKTMQERGVARGRNTVPAARSGGERNPRRSKARYHEVTRSQSSQSNGERYLNV